MHTYVYVVKLLYVKFCKELVRYPLFILMFLVNKCTRLHDPKCTVLLYTTWCITCNNEIILTRMLLQDGSTALHYATLSGKFSVVEELIRLGADVNTLDVVS